MVMVAGRTPFCYHNPEKNGTEIMALHIVIDGYNLLGAARRIFLPDLEEQREALIKDLSRYRTLKGVMVTVVFDGKRSGRISRSREVRSGVEVLFSKEGEEADALLKDMAGKMGQNVTIVTSDREVRFFAESRGAVVIGSGEFFKRLETALYMEEKGLLDEEEEEEKRSGRKKGPSQRLPKSKRRRELRKKKL